MEEAISSDARERALGKRVPDRYGVPIDVDFGLDHGGQWDELSDGSRIWRIRIVSTGAASLQLLYDRFFMPPGATFYVYSEDREDVLGAFTFDSNRENGKFATSPVEGEVVTLEYHEPLEVRGKGQLHVARIIHAFKDVIGQIGSGRSEMGKTAGIETVGACQRNVNCSEGASWQNQKRAVALILNGSGALCTATLINTGSATCALHVKALHR